MSKELIDRSPDLVRLQHEGYSIQIVHGHLLIHDVPYLDNGRNVRRGILVSVLDESGGRTLKPKNHVAYFIGDRPCNANGSPLSLIIGEAIDLVVGILQVNFQLSGKDDYQDYYEKMTRYVRILTDQANEVDPNADARKFQVFESEDPESVFVYPDTNSRRALINPITAKLEKQKIAIIGLGGTGAYILDLIAKTPVQRIDLFDGDHFLQHNAFRSPGAASIESFYERWKKTDYLQRTYSNIHKHITSHPYCVDESNVSELGTFDFVFISMDSGPTKKVILNFLQEQEIPFIDCGLGIQDVDGALTGQVRVTMGTAEQYDHLPSRISFAEQDENLYDKNIQIADLNSLNATLAVIKWKKFLGFYKDMDREFFSSYGIYTNEITNDDLPI